MPGFAAYLGVCTAHADSERYFPDQTDWSFRRMLVTFRSDWGNVTMFGDVAHTLLKMAGHSGTVPSALLAADIPAALTRLKQGLAAAAEATNLASAPPDADDEDPEPPLGLDVRAHPLIELLSASAREGYDVMWDKGT